MKRFIYWLRKKFPLVFDEQKYQEQLVYKEAHELNAYLIDSYSPEEQTKIIYHMKNYLENHRIQQITETEQYLDRLKEDLSNIRKI